jgi:hypothetical protein
MPIKEVRSRISSSSPRHPGPASAQPLSPGARSHPSARARGDQAPSHEPEQPTHARVSLGGDEGATVHVVGPEQRTDRRRDSTPQGEAREQRTSVSDRTQDAPRNEIPPAEDKGF